MRKLAVVTGGTKGIGRAIVNEFVNQGFDVATCARHKKDLEELQLGVSQNGGKAYVFVADMSVKKEVMAFADYVRSLQRPVDVLVNNAGYFAPGAICTEPEGTLEGMMHANVYSAYNMTRGLAGVMKQQKDGHIFNICSIASLMAYANGGSYAITKFAMLGLSKCLREELMNDGIRVTAVMPGATLTASWEGVNLPEDRFMKAEDVAELVYSCYAISKRSVVEEILIRPLLGDI